MHPSRGLLAHFSPYFRACFNGNFKEGIEGVRRLPDDEPAYFEALIDWMRTDTATLNFTMEVTQADREEYNQHIDEESLMIRKCLECIEFCDKYDICKAAAAVAHIVRQYIHLADYETVMPIAEFCYGRLHSDNPVLEAMTGFAVGLILDGSREGMLEGLMEHDKIAGPAMRRLLERTVPMNGALVPLRPNMSPRGI